MKLINLKTKHLSNRKSEKVYLNRRETFSMLKSIIIKFGWLKLLQPSGIFEDWLFFPKKGDLSLQKNYKGIMILEIAYKIIAIIL